MISWPVKLLDRLVLQKLQHSMTFISLTTNNQQVLQRTNFNSNSKAVAELLKSGHDTMKPPRSLTREVVTLAHAAPKSGTVLSQLLSFSFCFMKCEFKGTC